MIEAFREKFGVEVLHAWGMTEMSPWGTLCSLKNKHLALSAREQMSVRLKQGRALFGIDMKIIDRHGVIVFFLQIDTLPQKNSSRDKHLQNRLSETPCAFGAD